ncbi:MAG: SprT family zinc-dependent metalloprotease [Planctomycetota bacterium]
MEINYKIVRSSRRKKLNITVERDRSVVVYAPVNISEKKIQEIIASKRQWILEKMRHPQKYKNLLHPPGKEMVNGESAMYLGCDYLIEIVKNGARDIHFAQKFFVPNEPLNTQREIFREWYIERAKEHIFPRVQHYAHQLGVEYTKSKIVDNRYLWGSCTVKNNINFNWRLIKAPMSIIDYVVVHELAHLIEPNHTPKFWNIVRSQLVNVENAKQWLKENGQLLEQMV